MRNCDACGRLVSRSTLDEYDECDVQCVCFACDTPFVDGSGRAAQLELCRVCAGLHDAVRARAVSGVEIIQIDDYWDGPQSGLCRLGGLVFPFAVVTDLWHVREFEAYSAPLAWIGERRHYHLSWRQGLAAAYRGEPDPFRAHMALSRPSRLNRSRPLFTFEGDVAQWRHLRPAGVHRIAKAVERG